jgi:hypothetical protein
MVYPAAVTVKPSSPGAESGRVQPSKASQLKDRTGETGGENQEPAHNAVAMVGEFLGREPGLSGDYSMEFIIALLPDPLDSRLPYFFDSFLDSIQRAVEASGFQLDRFDLPWLEARGKDRTAAQEAAMRRFEYEPGRLLFRSPEIHRLLWPWSG